VSVLRHHHAGYAMSIVKLRFSLESPRRHYFELFLADIEHCLFRVA
jgi:hypothetical protein